MGTNYGKHFSTRTTPQSEPAREDQKQNNAGGYAFTLDIWGRLDRWLILGAEGGTYYVSEKQLTKDNAKTVLECLKADPTRTLNRIVEISKEGRAPKNDPAIFALALAAGDENLDTRKAALALLPQVCRIGTHLFHFARDVENFRKWGRGLRNAVAAWYNEKSSDKLGYDLVKYQQRDGWSHADLLRLSHPVPKTPEHGALFRYVTTDYAGLASEREVKRRLADKTEKVSKYPMITATLPRVVLGFELAKVERDPKKVAAIISEYGLTHEMIPNEVKGSPEVWEALLEHMPLGALVRNLNKMTSVGLLKPMGSATKEVVSRLHNVELIRKARLHPVSLLVAMLTYKAGKGDKGSLTWTPLRELVDALDESFYLSFQAIEPTGKNTLLAIDISGSMDGGCIAGARVLTPRIASAAMAMVTARAEKNWHVVGFTSSGGFGFRIGESKKKDPSQCYPGLTNINISPRMRLDDVVSAMQALPMGGTDCALPMIYAREAKMAVEVFHVYTDSETWAGAIHPFQALRDYRQTMGIPAKLCVVGMTATEFTIADPNDGGMLDVVGFDTAAPAVMADFARQ